MKLVDFLQGQDERSENCQKAQEGPRYRLFPFYKSGAPFEGRAPKVSESQEAAKSQKRLASPKIARPLWGMTMKAAGSMRFRWNETNPNRDQFLAELCALFGGAEKGGQKKAVPLELIHSKIVYEAREACDTLNKQGDGIVTQNPSLVPVVTAADCVPLYFYDAGTGAFGAAHSGWKGTGSQPARSFCRLDSSTARHFRPGKRETRLFLLSEKTDRTERYISSLPVCTTN